MRFFVLLMLFINGQCLFAQSSIVWSQTAQIAGSQYGNMHPRVTTDASGNPLILWGNSNTKQAFFTRWTGSGFANPVNINPPLIPISTASWTGPDLASHGDTIYVVFKETPEDDGGIYIMHSFDGGVNFSGPERVDAIADSISRFPAVGTDANGQPLVAFMKFNPGWGSARYVLAKSDDYGNTFGADVLGSRFSGGNVCDCCPATVTSSGNTTALLYRDNLNNLRNSWAGISFDAGVSFPEGIEIDNTDWNISSCPASGPDGIIYGNNLYSVFMSAASGKTLCYRSRSSLNNLQMELTEPLTGNFTGLVQQNFPRIAAYENAVAVVWPQTVNGSTQLAVQFTNNISNGFSTGYDVLVANNVMNADVTISANGKIYVVWEDMNSGTVKYKAGTYTASGTNTPSSQEASVQVYPNPASPSDLYLQFDEPDDAPVAYSIFSAQGQRLVSGTGQAREGVLKVNVSGLSTGIYFIKIQHGKEIAFRPLVLQNKD